MEAASLRDAGLGGGAGWHRNGLGETGQVGWRQSVRDAVGGPGWSWRSDGGDDPRDTVPRDRAKRLFVYVGLVTAAAVASTLLAFDNFAGRAGLLSASA